MYSHKSTPIKLVTNGDIPLVDLIIKDVRNEEVIDFSLYAGITSFLLIRSRSRRRGTCSDDTTTKVTGVLANAPGTDGKWSYNMATFLASGLDEGDYEAEVNFDDGGVVRKLFHMVNLSIREGLIE